MQSLRTEFIYFLIFLATPIWCVDPIVLTQQGLVRGVWSDDGEYSMFMGIPFAEVNPDNPFGDALPGPKFDGIFEANDDSAMCPQIDTLMGGLGGNLDCLHLNVYVPRSASMLNPLPVMVWIYGGGFSQGSAGLSLFGPQFLVRHNVILVTVNYRVGPYGFMCLDTPSVPGNAGLKDQRRGLEWVQENIAAFGGDKTSVTAFGESAGAMSLEYHMLSPGSNGLFHRAILQSGSALVEQLLIHSRPSAPIELAQNLGFQVETLNEALDIIKHVPTDDLVLAHQSLGITFKPCLEKVFDGVESFITNFPDHILASGQYENVPIITGHTSDEQLGAYFNTEHDENYFNKYKNVFYERINGSFNFESAEQLEKAVKMVKEFYIGTKSISEETIFQMIDFDSDAHFLNPIERSIKYRMTTSNKPVYQFVFQYSGRINTMKQFLNISYEGAAHGDDIAFLFNSVSMSNEISSEDQLVIDRMTTMWTNFAKYSDPTPEVSNLLPVRWPAVSEDREYILIGSDLKIDRKPFHSRLAFWDLLFQAYGKYFRMIWSSCQNCVYEN